MKTTPTIALGLVGSLITAIALPARANLFFCCSDVQRWNSTAPNITIRAEPTHYPTTGSYFHRIQDAAAAWQNLQESNITISVVSDTDGGQSLMNTQSELYDASGHSPDSDTFIAATFRHFVGGFGACSGAGLCTAPRIDAADIVFYQTAASEPGGTFTTIPWSSAVPNGLSNDAFTDPGTYFLPTLMHEMGHLLGLEHTPSGTETMSTNYPFGGWDYGGASPCHPFKSEQVEANFLYPASANFSDMYVGGVVNAGGVSRQLSYDPITDSTVFYPHNTTPITGFPFNVVRRGQQFQINYCRGNMGNAATGSQTVTAYFSSDRAWSVNDPPAGGSFVENLSGHAGTCNVKTFTIPNTLSNGLWWVLVGPGTSGNDIAIQNRQIQVIN